MDRCRRRRYNERMGLMRSGPDNPHPRTSTATRFLWLTALFLFVLLVAVLALR